MLSRLKNALGRRLDDAKERVQGMRGQPAAAPPAYRPPVDLSKAAPKPAPVEVKAPPSAPVVVATPPAPAPILAEPVVAEPVVAAPPAAPAPVDAAPVAEAAAQVAQPAAPKAAAKKASTKKAEEAARKAEEAEAAEAARKVEAAEAAETARRVDEEAAAAQHAIHVAAAATKKAEAPKKVEEPASLAARALALAKGQGENKMIHADMGSTDLEHYIARAKANGRDLSTIKGGVGLNKNDDGSAFWGPVDNTSSRAKAEGKMLTVDQWECISCGTCVEQTDKVFYLPADGKATPIAQDGPMDLIEDAIEACPVTCIHWVTPDEAADRGLATGLEADSPRPE